MKISNFALVAVAALVAAAGSANAAFITQVQNVPVSPTDITGTQGTKTFQYWQAAKAANMLPALATLTSVELQIKVIENLTALSVSNTASNPNTFRYLTYSNITVVGTPAGLAADRAAIKAAINANGGVNGNIDLYDTGLLAYTPNETKTFSPPTINAMNSSGFVNSTNFALYDLLGTFDLGFTTLTFQTFTGGGGNGASNQTTTASAEITVRYNYEIIPAPGSAALLGLGGLVAVRRRRQA